MEGKSKRAKRLMTLLRAAAAAQGGAAKGSRKEARRAPTAAEAGNGLERRNGRGEERRGREEREGTCAQGTRTVLLPDVAHRLVSKALCSS